jgi:hypothetical protein
MRQRMAKIRQQSNRTGQFSADTLINRAQQGTLSQRPYALGDSLNLLRRDTIRRPYIFGAALFKGTALTFEPNLRIATPRNYIVGPDDELIVEIYGNSTESFRLRVTPEGSVRMLNLAPIFVSGLTIEQAEQRIVGRLATGLSGFEPTQQRYVRHGNAGQHPQHSCYDGGRSGHARNLHNFLSGYGFQRSVSGGWPESRNRFFSQYSGDSQQPRDPNHRPLRLPASGG